MLTTLLPPPKHHPTTNWLNHADPNEQYDRDAKFHVARLLDRRGKPSKLAYLTEWKICPLQFTWVWEEDLGDDCSEMMDKVDEWKTYHAGGGEQTVAQFMSKRQQGATASALGRCFLESFQSALHFAGLGGVVTAALWDSYARASQKDFTEGVKRGEQVEFYRFVCSQGLKLDFIPATKNVLTTAITSVGKLVDFVAAVEPGVFVVHAGQDLDEHCFALVVGDDGRGQVAEDFNEAKSPPCVLEPLSNLEWIEQVYSIRRIRATSNSFKGRRMKRMKLM